MNPEVFWSKWLQTAFDIRRYPYDQAAKTLGKCVSLKKFITNSCSKLSKLRIFLLNISYIKINSYYGTAAES